MEGKDEQSDRKFTYCLWWYRDNGDITNGYDNINRVRRSKTRLGTGNRRIAKTGVIICPRGGRPAMPQSHENRDTSEIAISAWPWGYIWSTFVSRWSNKTACFDLTEHQTMYFGRYQRVPVTLENGKCTKQCASITNVCIWKTLLHECQEVSIMHWRLHEDESWRNFSPLCTILTVADFVMYTLCLLLMECVSNQLQMTITDRYLKMMKVVMTSKMPTTK